MIKTPVQIYLASRSPRRKKLLTQIGLNFKTFAVEIDETPLKNESPIHCVKRLSAEKLNAALKKIKSGIIITADTIVVLDKKIINKPDNKTQAVNFLKMLSGKTHAVYTGFQVFNSTNSKKYSGYEKTKVEFRKLDEDEILDYVDSGSPLDKAGAYGIQDDYGAVFVKKITGCYYNVVGLPLVRIYESLKQVI
jgi:nucleoside triphosphate pyrophosphatase